MKRAMKYFGTAILWGSLLLPMTVQAKTYHVPETDLHIEIDDSMWYVFTRENIENNPELEELGIADDYMHDVLYDNDVYLDGLVLYENGDYLELFVRKVKMKVNTNLTDADQEDVEDFAEKLVEELGANDYELYENDYKFIHVEFYDTASGCYINQYITVVNGDGYVMSFQGSSEFIKEEYEEMEKIVESVRFDIDPNMKQKTSKDKESSIWKSALKGGIKGALIGGGAGAVATYLKKKKKKSDLDKIDSIDNDQE